MRSQTFFKILRKINFWGPNYSRCLNFRNLSPALTPYYSYRACRKYALRVITWNKIIQNPNRIAFGEPTFISLHFLDQFLSLSLSSKVWCFSWFRKLPMDPNWCFLMPWWSRDHPRLILDWFGKIHFFMKNLKILTLKVDEVTCFTIPRINSFDQIQCDSKLK